MRPPSLSGSIKVIESRSKSYSDLSNKHQRSNMEQEQCSLFTYCWGRNKFHEYPTNWTQPIVDVACGQKHTVFLTNKFEVFACGDNQYGQLGCTSQNYHAINTPIQIMKDISVANIFCGPYNTFVCTTKGDVYGMGINSRGQLGINNDSDQKNGPVLIQSLSFRRYREASRGRITTQLQPQSSILTERQQSQDNIPARQYTPQKKYRFFDEGSDNQFIKQITCGPFHTLVLLSKGRIFTSGLKLSGDLSSNDYSVEFTEMRLKNIMGSVEQISSGLTSNAILTNDGKVYVWGVFKDLIIEEPTLINIKNVIEVRLGGEYDCLLNAKGEVYQLYQDQNETIKPRKVQGLPHIRSIKCGVDFAMAIATESKQLFAWGRNRHGQIVPGKASQLISNIPIICRTPQIVRLYCGSYHSVILTKKPQVQAASPVKPLQFQDFEQQNTKKKSVKSVRIQTDPMSKFDLNSNINPRTFSTSLEIPFSQLTLQKQISEGGYGIIYRGKWRQTTVAVKLFKIDNSESSIKDFLSQCHAMEALRHPNIVLFLGACTKPPNFAIVLEYCSKGTLWSILQSAVELSWQDRRRFALDTARGMNYLHSSEVPILHRDLKSLNLLLDQSYRVKLADFGWTKGLENYMTQKIGTYQWMAPEVISGQKYTEKADVFSFGIILWEIASRQPPYRNVSGIQVSLQVVNNHLRPTIPKKTPQAFSKLMRRCWDRNPEIRPSFKEIIRELEMMKLTELK